MIKGKVENGVSRLHLAYRLDEKDPGGTWMDMKGYGPWGIMPPISLIGVDMSHVKLADLVSK